MEDLSINDPNQLLEAASDFAYYPGVQNDASAKSFLDRFPLPLIINALQTKTDFPGLEGTLVACLERVFRTKYGASLIPQFMAFVQVGLRTESQIVRCLACKTVTCLFENYDETSDSAAQQIIDFDIYPLLLDCLLNGDEQVANASMEAIKRLASTPKGEEIIFPANKSQAMHLGNLATQCSSLGRVRIMALIVKLFSVSRSAASAVHNSNLLGLLEEEIRSTKDTLVTLSVLELLYELVQIQHGTEFLSGSSFLEILSSIIRNSSVEPILRSRAMIISGRFLSEENIYQFIDESGFGNVISAIDCRLEQSESQDTEERESALEALGQIGSTGKGATLILSGSPPAARHVIEAAFNQHKHGEQLAALHALGNISGENRSENDVILTNDAEESQRRMIYQIASRSPKLTPSGLFLSVLQQNSEIRIVAYRMITGLVARPWCLMEICSRQEIVNIMTDPTTETTKIGMEARYNCCIAIHNAFTSSPKLMGDPSLAPIVAKVQEAIRNGPYLARKQFEAQPAVMTADRF